MWFAAKVLASSISSGIASRGDNIGDMTAELKA
jgi:hypothetical protein